MFQFKFYELDDRAFWDGVIGIIYYMGGLESP